MILDYLTYLPTCHPGAELSGALIYAAINLKTFKTRIATKHKFACAKTDHQMIRKGTKNMLESVCFSASYTVLYFKCLKCQVLVIWEKQGQGY